MKGKGKLCALALSGMLLLGGCGAKQAQAPEKTELTALQYELENMAVDFNDLWFYDRIAEQTGVEVSFTDVKDSEWTSALSLAFARGNMPDLILRGSLDVEEYGVSRHMLVPLDEYMAQGFLPNYASRLAEGNLREQLTASDGHMYQLGFLISQGVNTNGHFFINQDWLDALNLAVPTTVEGLTEALRKFREEDPNGNGLQDEIPMEFTFDDNNTGIYNLFSFFGLPLNEEFVYLDEAGQVRFAPDQAAFAETLDWMHQLAEEGLLDIDFISQGSNIWADKVNEGNVGMFSYWRLQNTALSPQVISMYRVMKPVAAEGRRACLPRLIDLVEFGAALTTDNRDIEASLRWLDAQFETENMLVSQNGEVGDTLLRQEDGRYAVAYVPGDNELYRKVPVICGQFFAPAEYYAQVYVPASHRQEKSAYCALYEEAGVLEATSSKILTATARKTGEEDARLTRLQAALKPLINGAIVDMVTTGVTEEKLTALAGKLREAGSEEYRSIYQQIYDRWQAEN
ncbi:MAG: extracellular solute-binding protein [Clostridia bacterium]|nr:extracellular solute-binding protein [Clostridia bacterium]